MEATSGLGVYLCPGYYIAFILLWAFGGTLAVVLGVVVGIRGVYLPIAIVVYSINFGAIGADL